MSERNEAEIRKAQFDQLKAEHVKRGMTPEQAAEQAYRDFLPKTRKRLEIEREIWRRK